MTILITGVAGFIGSRIALHLLRAGADVRGIDSFSNYYSVDIKQGNTAPLVKRGLDFVQQDLVDADLRRLLDGVTHVYHQAGQPGVRASWGSSFHEYVHSNVTATQRLLEACVNAPHLEAFVYASSSSVYGNALTYPTTEQTLPAPVSPYGVTKLAAEHLCTLYAANYGVPTRSLRYFTVYGPGQRPDMAFTRFCRAAVLSEPITLYGDGLQIRDFTYVDDIVQANLQVAASEAPSGSVFNVAGGSQATVLDAIRIVEELSGREIVVQREEAALGDVARTAGTTSRLSAATGWRPEVDPATGLREQYDWALSTYRRSE